MYSKDFLSACQRRDFKVKSIYDARQKYSVYTIPLHIHSSPDHPPVSKSHLFRILIHGRPHIDPAELRFFEKYIEFF